MDSFPVSIQVSGASDPGQRRANNEDSIWWRHDAGGGTDSVILAVADGMGGAAAGEVASQAAINECRRVLVGDVTSRDALTRLGEALTAANARVYRLAETTEEYAGMGTTLTLALILSSKLYVAHVGDSRCYLVREGVCTQVTTDHTWVAEEIESGRLKAEEAAQHPARKAISRAVGLQAELDVDTYGPIDLADNDIVILCSDGLTDVVSDDEIGQSDTGHGPVQTARDLISLANSRGGPDNISVIAARVSMQRDEYSASVAVPGRTIPQTVAHAGFEARAHRRGTPTAILIAVPVVALMIFGLTGLAVNGAITGSGSGGAGNDVVTVIPSRTSAPLLATGTAGPTPSATLAPTPTTAAVDHVATSSCGDGAPAFEHIAVDGAAFPSHIAARYGINTEDVMACDPSLDPFAIHIGDIVLVPCIPPISCSEAAAQ